MSAEMRDKAYKTVDRLDNKLGVVTLNVGWEAYRDLEAVRDEIDKEIGYWQGRNWPNTDLADEIIGYLEDMAGEVEDTLREIDDKGYLEDDEPSPALMDMVEGAIGDLSVYVQDIQVAGEDAA